LDVSSANLNGASPLIENLVFANVSKGRKPQFEVAYYWLGAELSVSAKQASSELLVQNSSTFGIQMNDSTTLGNFNSFSLAPNLGLAFIP
jgi:hypothetical protein